MKPRSDCNWCMSTQHIVRKISPGMPEEYQFRCSACHEQYWEDHVSCDGCERIIDKDNEDFSYLYKSGGYKCDSCSKPFLRRRNFKKT